MYPTRGCEDSKPSHPIAVDSGPLEHDCLEIMDEVFSSQTDLTDQPISHLDVEYFMTAAALSGMTHVLLDMQ
jgi:hypothetical protein